RAGGPIGSGERSRVLRPAREVIGRPDMTWHHLRHTGATLAAIAGATQAELQARIGHSSTRAAAIYQHARSERDRWIADQLDQLAAPAPAAPDPEPGSPAPVPLELLRTASATTRAATSRRRPAPARLSAPRPSLPRRPSPTDAPSAVPGARSAAPPAAGRRHSTPSAAGPRCRSDARRAVLRRIPWGIVGLAMLTRRNPCVPVGYH